MNEDLATLLASAAFNFGVAVVIVRFIYYPVTQDKRYVFSFLTFNTIVFFVLQFLGSSQLSIGAGFGLFAIFSVLNYRTNELPIREMTYLFTLIALPVINSFLVHDGDIAQIGVANAFIVLVIFVLEREWGFHFQSRKKMTYEVIENVRPENYGLLIEDLKRRTGLPVKHVEVGRIDFLRDTAQIEIFYDEPETVYDVRSGPASDAVSNTSPD
jgi:hypothetical protein